MSDLELLTNKLDEYGFGYKIGSPIEPETEANLVVIAKSSLSYVHHFYFKNCKYVRSDTGSEYIIEFKHESFDWALEFMSKMRPDREVKEYSHWKHFKGTMAEVITVAKDSETGEEMVVYRCTGNHGQTNHTDGVYVRPMKMFLSEVDHEKYPDVKTKYRFTKAV